MFRIHVLEMVLVQMARTQKNKATSQHLGLLKVSPDSRFAELPTISNSGLWFQSLQRSLVRAGGTACRSSFFSTLSLGGCRLFSPPLSLLIAK